MTAWLAVAVLLGSSVLIATGVARRMTAASGDAVIVPLHRAPAGVPLMAVSALLSRELSGVPFRFGPHRAGAVISPDERDTIGRYAHKDSRLPAVSAVVIVTAVACSVLYTVLSPELSAVATGGGVVLPAVSRLSAGEVVRKAG